jgi:hypothetical protein
VKSQRGFKEAISENKKAPLQNDAVQKPIFIFPPFQAREAQAFLSVPSGLFSPPTACHGFTLGKAVQRELTFNAGYYISNSPAFKSGGFVETEAIAN